MREVRRADVWGVFAAVDGEGGKGRVLAAHTVSALLSFLSQ